MKKIITFPILILAAALVPGLAMADDSTAPAPAVAPAPAAISHGLLGQTYINLGYSYTNYTDTNVNANTYGFAFNQGVREGLDTLLEYSYTQSSDTGFGHIDQQIFDVGGRVFTNYNGVKPYAEAGVGGLWIKTPDISHQRSFLWFVGVGAELPAATDLTFTPFVRLMYANSVDNHKVWDYGVRGNYWLTERLALTGSLTRDNSRDMSYGVGVNIRY